MNLKTISGIVSVFLCTLNTTVAADVQPITPVESYEEQHYCMALNIYHESRAESKLGQLAVGFVTMNRVYSKDYPNTVCDVVYQAQLNSHGQPIRNKCQFSWFCDGKSDKPRDEDMWFWSKQVAHQVLHVYDQVEDFTEGSIMYHATYVRPYWIRSYERVVQIDNHIFYK
jgi:N-acetylmuramoyl-L-alanine amidase